MKPTSKLLTLFLLASLLTTLAWGVLPAGRARADGAITVTSAADSVGSDGACTLREAITNANADTATYTDCASGSGSDTVTFAANATLTLAGSQLPVITSAITLIGNGEANTILQANANPNTATFRVFEVGSGGSLTLNNLTIQNGSCNDEDIYECAYSNGGGIFNAGTLALAHVTLRNNYVGFSGGGIYNQSGSSVTLTNVTLSGNRSYYGGGMFNDGNSATLTAVVFDNNLVSGEGGGMYNSNSHPTLTNVAFNGNYATDGGGGMANRYYGSPTLTDVTFNSNYAPNGGGMINIDHSNPALERVTFDGNYATRYGGGMYNAAVNPTLNAVTFHDNFADRDGGGIYNSGSSPVLANILFDDNAATNYGGGMSDDSYSSPTLTDVTFHANLAGHSAGMFNNDHSSPSLTNVTFDGNHAGYSGGMTNYNGNPTLTNVTFSANRADTDFAGMYNYNSNPTLANVTFSDNQSAGSTAGLYNYNSTPTLKNVILANSVSGGDCVNEGGSALNPASSNNLVEDSANACGLVNGVNGNIVGQDPALAPLADNGGATQTHALYPGSLAIDAGTNTGCPASDQRGLGRPQGARCDIGAYESISAWLVDSAADTVANDGQTTLREALRAANNPVGGGMGGVIRFAPGMAGQTITFSAAAEDNTYGPSAFGINYPTTVDATGVAGIVLQRDNAAPEMRLFYVAAGGSLTLKGVTLSNGLARGGDGGSGPGGGGGGAAGLGGAIFTQGTLTLEGVTVRNNQAIGGNGAAGGYCGGGGGGGGGGMGGDGAATGSLNGGAGGGPNGGAGGAPGPQNTGAPGGVGGGGGGGMSWMVGGVDYQGYNGGAGGIGAAGGGGGCGTSFYQKGVGGAGGFGGGAGGNSTGEYTWVSGGFGGGSNNVSSFGGGGAGMGGAIFNHGGVLSITNSTLSGNTVQGGSGANSGSGLGGAIFNRAGTVTILNSTLAYNTVAASSGASKEGGALYSYADGGVATVNVINSILSDTTGGNDAANNGGAVSGSHNIVMSGSGFSGVTLSSASPNLAALADNGGGTFTHAIVPPSPALHTGTSTGAPAADQRGIPRDTRPDIGAFELQATITFADPAGLCGGNIPCFTTIGGATGAVLNGGTTVLYPATYNETVTLNKAITVQADGNLTLNGSLDIRAGAFNAGSGNLTLNGDFTLGGGSFTAPGGLLDVSGASSVSGGTFTYTANGAIREQRSASGTPTLTFPLTGVTIAVTANTDLSAVQVTRHEQNHPGATTSATQTGRYWTLAPTGSGFTVNLTLPTSFTPDANDKLCRYTAGPGYGWDCGAPANHTFSGNTLTRYGVTAFSDWTVGDGAGPTAVQLTNYQVRSPGQGWGWLVAGIALAGLLLAWGRWQGRRRPEA